MHDNNEFSTITHAEASTWGLIILAAVCAGAFRVLRNGQWKGFAHAVGVVGCSAIVSGFMASLCLMWFDFGYKQPMTLIWLSGAVSLLGKEIHEKLILGGLKAITPGKGISTDDPPK